MPTPHRKLLKNFNKFMKLRFFLTLTALISHLHGTSIIAPTFPELVAEAQVIARVKVSEIRPAWIEANQGRIIKTFVTFEVIRLLKGTPNSTFTLSFLGGEIEGEALRVEGMPRFALDQTDIIFLSDMSGATFRPLVGLMHGRYRVLTDPASGQAYVARNDGVPLKSEDDVQLPQFSSAPANRLKSVERALSPDIFEALIAAEISSPAPKTLSIPK